MDVNRLIRALENATEGDETLDTLIHQLVGFSKPVPLYTRSMDAAMRLIPDGWSIHKLRRETGPDRRFAKWAAELYREGDCMLTIPTYVLASTAPLALCATSLRAWFGMTSEDREVARKLDRAVQVAREKGGGTRSVEGEGRLPRTGLAEIA